jgi:hypothetical protein
VPTYEVTSSFERDLDALDDSDRKAFKKALTEFIADLTAKEEGRATGFRRGLRVKPMRNADGIWEMTWSIKNGRATFSYGREIEAGKMHVVWRRIGTHEVFRIP